MNVALARDTWSATVAAIYDAAVDPNSWADVLNMLCEQLDCELAVMGLMQLPQAELTLSASVGVDRRWRDKLEIMGHEVLQFWGGTDQIVSHPLSEPLVLSALNPGALEPGSSDPFYNRYAEPLGFTEVVSILLGRETNWFGAVSFARLHVPARLTRDQMEILRLIAPHLQRAAAINQLLNVQTLAAATFKAVLDSLSFPTMVIDSCNMVLFANSAARRMFGRSDPLLLRGNRLAVREPRARQALESAISHAVSGQSELSRDHFGVGLRAADGRAHAVHVIPLVGGDLRPMLLPGGAAVIFLMPADDAPALPSDLLGSLFGLSSAESIVFEWIASGASVAATADSLGVARSTIRTHLNRIFEKTDVHRQSDLVALSRSLAGPVGKTHDLQHAARATAKFRKDRGTPTVKCGCDS